MKRVSAIKRGRRRTSTNATATVALLGTLLLGAGCGDDTSDDLSRRAGDAVDDAAGAVDAGTARVQAEAFRLQVKNLTSNDASRYATMSILQQAAADLPGSPTVSGIADANGDGKDDDGKIEITVDSSKACVTVTADDTRVDGGAC